MGKEDKQRDLPKKPKPCLFGYGGCDPEKIKYDKNEKRYRACGACYSFHNSVMGTGARTMDTPLKHLEIYESDGRQVNDFREHKEEIGMLEAELRNLKNAQYAKLFKLVFDIKDD